MPVTWALHVVGDLAHAGSLSINPCGPPMFCICWLVAQVVEVEALALGDLLRDFAALSFVDLLLDLFDQTEHVAHVEDAAGRARIGWNTSGPSVGLRRYRRNDRFAGDVANRGAAPPRASSKSVLVSTTPVSGTSPKCFAVTAAS